MVTRQQFEYWSRQARFVARQLAPAHLVDEMALDGLASLVTSLRTFDPAKNDNLGGYVLQRMRWAILDALRVHRAGSRRDTERGVFYAEVPLGDAPVLPAVSTDRLDLSRAIATLPRKMRAFMFAYLRLGDVGLAAASLGMSQACGWQMRWQAVRTLRKILVQTETAHPL